MVHNPMDWTDEQLAAYLQDSTANLTLGMMPVVQICSPLAAANMLLSILANIALANPQWITAILSSMAEVAEALDREPRTMQ
jgi:hypothetical protein